MAASSHQLAITPLPAHLPGLIVFAGGLLAGSVVVVSASRRYRRQPLAAQPVTGQPGCLPSPVVETSPCSAITTTPPSTHAAQTIHASDAPVDSLTGLLLGRPVSRPGLLSGLERFGIVLAAGPPAAVGAMIGRTAFELSRGALAGGCDVILVGFPDAPGRPVRATSCQDLGSALDMVVGKAVTLRRMHAEARQERHSPAGPPAKPPPPAPLTMLISRIAPTAAELTLLVDLAAEPGGLAALLPTPGTRTEREARVQPGGRSFTVITLAAAPATTPEPAARVRASAPLAAAPNPAAPNPAVSNPAVSNPAAAPHLRIGLLGTLTVNGQPGALVPAQSQLIVALALSGRAGLSNRRLCALLGADEDHPRPTDSLRQLIVRTRRQLGQAGDGREWLEHLGHGNYALHPDAQVDWAEFDTLTTEGIKVKSEQDLTKALSMVRGQPFAGCYYWWLDLTVVESVTARILTAAQLLAEIRLADGDAAAAARAARTGLTADPAAEELWRLLMRAEHAAGNLAGVREAWTRYRSAIAEISADGEPDEETAAVFAGLINGQASSQARKPPVPAT